MKKILSLSLALAFVLCSALSAFADTGLANFNAVKEYTDGQFTDVSADDWFAPYVEQVFDLALMEGNSTSAFNPGGNVTLAETVTVAARLNSIYNGIALPEEESEPWYQKYVDYALDCGIIAESYSDFNAPATRSEYAAILANSLGDDAFDVISTVEDNMVPDVDMTAPYAEAVYKLYRAGILTGSDDAGTFNPESNIKRSEVAAVIARMADPSLRITITLTDYDAQEEIPGGFAGVPNPLVEYETLEEINEKVGVDLMKPQGMDISNEKYFVISGTGAQYVCEMYGREWTFRAAHVTDMDISGMYSEYNQFAPGGDFVLYTNEFYLDRFFVDDRQYTIVVKDPITEDGDVVIGEDVFTDCCMALKQIQKYHMDDPLVGDYQDTVSQRATAYVERIGDIYNISVNWSDSASEFNCWTMLNAVKDGDRLTYRGEEIGHYTYDDEGNETSADVTMADNIGYFEIKDGLLYWTGAAQEACRACVFEKIAYEE